MPKQKIQAGSAINATAKNTDTYVERLESLTFLRFIAALVVVISHYGPGTLIYSSLPTILNCGPIMVTFFFVLSGFVLAISNTGKKISASQFYINRAARIVPIYIIALLSFMILSASLFNEPFFMSALLVQSWFQPNALSLNYPGWSISVEVFFYAICPLLIFISNAGDKINIRTWFISAIFLWAFSQVALSYYSRANQYGGFGTPSHFLINYFPPSHLCSFVLGFTAGLMFKAGVLRSAIGEKTSLIISAILFAIIGKIIDFGPRIDTYLGEHLAYASSLTAILFAPAIYFCAIANKLLKNIFIMPALVILGEASYSLYILQEPAHLIFRMIPAQYLTESHTINFALFLVFLISVSVASYFLIEKTFSRIIKSTYKSLAKPSLKTTATAA
ncbi:acyltransferase family protein [Pseudomonas sp.]|uniref:acyltransferase family protein n=1 Tax=Pseudomonas sp. TaxID=306 RepID=UPI003FD76A7B